MEKIDLYTEQAIIYTELTRCAGVVLSYRDLPAITRNPKIAKALNQAAGGLGDVLVFLGGDMVKILNEKELLSCPGDTIFESLYERGISLKDFGAAMDMDVVTTQLLLTGKIILTAEMAKKLEGIFQVPAQFWINRETLYREKLLKIHGTTV